MRILVSVALLLACAPARSITPAPRVVLEGRWVLDERGDPVGADSFRRGLQTSGLVFRGGELWSVGDQRSQYPGHILRIDAGTARLAAAPARLEVPPRARGENRHFETYRTIPNSDFEGITTHPRDPSRLFAVTEDKVPWFVELEVPPGGAPAPRITGLAEIRFPEGLEPWRGSPNFRVEGIAISDDAKTAYLAFERATDDLPRLLEFPLETARGTTEVEATDVPIAFRRLERRADKGGARLNLNDIQFLRWNGTPVLLAVARDQERLLVIDLARREVRRSMDLELRDPDGRSIHWVSPEGLAVDVEGDRLWIINDPDSVRGNYRRRDTEQAEGRYADYAPLLFEMRLSAALGKDGASRGATGASPGKE